MIMSNDEVVTRLASPLNLINRLKELNNINKQEIACIPEVVTNNHNGSSKVVSLPPSIDELMDNLDDKIKLAGIKTAATDTLKSTIEVLNTRLCDAQGPERLSRVAKDMMHVIDTINGDRREHSANRPVIIFKPMLVNELSFGPIIHVNE